MNAIAPGFIDYGGMGAGPGDHGTMRTGSPPRYRRSIPSAGGGKPSDIAAAVAFLAGPDASFISGHTLVVDGGLTSQLRTPG